MKTWLAGMALAGWAAAACAAEFGSPGFPSSRMEADGRLVEDWGTVSLRLAGGEAAGTAQVDVCETRLDDAIPAAQAVTSRGGVTLTSTAYRAPAWPSGFDVLMARVEETRGAPADVTLAVELPPGARLGNRTVRVGGRTVLTLPAETPEQAALRDWGYCDDATALPGWAKPRGACDPAFRNIRAGLGGVPIAYRFAVPAKSAATVVLGFCESHWAERGQRPLICSVEGAAAQTVDPVARWGQHQPGALAFQGRDANGDGRLDIAVRTPAGAPDRNPILNVLWIFPAGEPVDTARVITGALNAAAARYVDVGGEGDQSIYASDKLEYKFTLPARGARELTFFAACLGDSAPMPETTAWTPATARSAARAVGKD